MVESTASMVSSKEREAIEAAGHALIEAMASLVHGNAFCADFDQQQMAEAVAHMATHALTAGLVRRYGRIATAAALGGLARGIGSILEQAPNPQMQAQALAFVDDRIGWGAADHAKVSKPMGSA